MSTVVKAHDIDSGRTRVAGRRDDDMPLPHMVAKGKVVGFIRASVNTTLTHNSHINDN